MFKKILVVFVTALHTEHTSEVAFEIAQKFGSTITFLKCIRKTPPKYGFFESKGQKEEHQKLVDKSETSLDTLEVLAKQIGIPIETKVELIDSLPKFLSSYVESNHVDLLIVDSHSLDDFQMEIHKVIINEIYKDVSCPILTLK